MERDRDPFANPLTAAAIADLDEGVVGAVIDSAIREALDDCDGRPMLDKARSVTLTLEFRPVPDERTGAMRAVEIDAQVRSKVPPRRTNPSRLRTSIVGDHAHAFLPDSHQGDLFATPAESDREAS